MLPAAAVTFASPPHLAVLPAADVAAPTVAVPAAFSTPPPVQLVAAVDEEPPAAVEASEPPVAA